MYKVLITNFYLFYFKLKKKHLDFIFRNNSNAFNDPQSDDSVGTGSRIVVLPVFHF